MSSTIVATVICPAKASMNKLSSLSSKVTFLNLIEVISFLPKIAAPKCIVESSGILKACSSLSFILDISNIMLEYSFI
ncbi:hypothetical protein D3C73_1365410 [compost metagenome]